MSQSKKPNGPKIGFIISHFFLFDFGLNVTPSWQAHPLKFQTKQGKSSFPWSILFNDRTLLRCAVSCALIFSIRTGDKPDSPAGGGRLTLGVAEVRRVLSVSPGLFPLSLRRSAFACIMDEMIHNLLSLLYHLKPMNNGQQPTCLFALEISEKRSNEPSDVLLAYCFLPRGYLFLFAPRTVAHVCIYRSCVGVCRCLTSLAEWV